MQFCSNAILLSYFPLAGPTILFFQENAGSILVVVDILGFWSCDYYFVFF
jgi:hypothetical protein